VEHVWSPAPARENRKGGAGLRAGDRDRGRGADGLFSLAAGPVGWVPPWELVEESVTTWWFVHTTPADRNVSLGGVPPPEIREDASALRRSASRARSRKAAQ
jgi:hypothetical protein